MDDEEEEGNGEELIWNIFDVIAKALRLNILVLTQLGQG